MILIHTMNLNSITLNVWVYLGLWKQDGVNTKCHSVTKIYQWKRRVLFSHIVPLLCYIYLKTQVFLWIVCNCTVSYCHLCWKLVRLTKQHKHIVLFYAQKQELNWFFIQTVAVHNTIRETAEIYIFKYIFILPANTFPDSWFHTSSWRRH